MTVRPVGGVFKMLGTGAALPGHAVSTAQVVRLLRERFGLKKWQLALDLAKQTGIATRYLCRDFVDAVECPRDGDSNPQLAGRALCEALAEAKTGVQDLEYLFGHTATPHTLLPPNISWVADQVGYNGPYVELRQACTGFASALQLAAGMIDSGRCRRVAIVGSETASIWLDPTGADEDPGQLVGLVRMGDGAGAVVVGADDGTPGDRISSLFFGTLGSGRPPGVTLPARHNARRGNDGKTSLWEFDLKGVRELGPRLFEEGLRAARLAGVRIEEVDWVLLHQAQMRVDGPCASRLGIPLERFVTDAGSVGHLGSASAWVGLHRLRKSEKLRTGNKVLVLASEASKYLFGGFLYTHG